MQFVLLCPWLNYKKKNRWKFFPVVSSSHDTINVLVKVKHLSWEVLGLLICLSHVGSPYATSQFHFKKFASAKTG